MTTIAEACDATAATVIPSALSRGAAAILQPEKRLMLAVLEGAVSDFQKFATATSGRGRFLFAEADAWFQSSGNEWPFDFEHICDALGIDASFVRAGLRRWCVARREQPVPARSVLHLPFRRTSGGTRQPISVAS